MSASTSERPVGGNRWVKAKSTSGWRAFDLKQRRKQEGLESDNDSEAYPSLSGLSAPRSLVNKDMELLEKPFSSVVVASLNYPSLTDVKNTNLPTKLLSSSSCFGTAHNTEVTDTIEAYLKLNYIHPWAEKCLIQDVLAGVNNNVKEALSLMEAMLICENEDVKNKEVESNENDLASFYIQGNSLGKKSFTNDPSNNNYKQSQDEAYSIQLNTTKSLSIISEPEWEEDDVYLIHRKDAMRMIRSASRFSKAANDAYIRGDHTTARHFSLKAQEEWSAAEKLNSKAGKNILSVRNCKNDLWTLDLHGLHAAEAVEALRDHLWTVESILSPTLDGIQKEPGMLLAPHVQCTNQLELEKVGRRHRAPRRQTRLLQVITGKGNHSRGAAALPPAIRNFLNENGYRFEETRPGVIMIRPKFRCATCVSSCRNSIQLLCKN